MNYAPFTDGGVQEVIQISSVTEPCLEVIKVNPCGVRKQLRILGPKVCGERLWNISLHPMEGQGTCHITKLLQNRVGQACQKRCELRHCAMLRRQECVSLCRVSYILEEHAVRTVFLGLLVVWLGGGVERGGRMMRGEDTGGGWEETGRGEAWEETGGGGGVAEDWLGMGSSLGWGLASCEELGVVMVWLWLGLKAMALTRLCLALARKNPRPGQRFSQIWDEYSTISEAMAFWPGFGLGYSQTRPKANPGQTVGLALVLVPKPKSPGFLA
ncbi:hypothetical protein C8J57DRAFT_1248556 [Mycena rebaudengoi]|nr:hypothetical protein C8J57DRAFT_1248556 [Mycena rebaudengoi]